MQVIICGAGQVGTGIAAYLSRESQNDITIIDHDSALLAQIGETMDVQTVLGHASCPDILSTAGAQEAEIIIAVTSSDEVNMVACQVAHSLFNVPRKVARLRRQEYMKPAWANLFSRAHMPIDHIISPEYEVAKAILKRLSVPGATNVIPLAGGKFYLCGVICEEDCPLINTQFLQLGKLFPDIHARIVAYRRGEDVFFTTLDAQLFAGDEAYLLCEKDHIARALDAFGHDEPLARRLVVMGGGNVGHALVEVLEKSNEDFKIKMIESSRTHAENINAQFEDIVVLHGDGLDKNILEEVNISDAQTFLAVTNDDETNALASLMAKQYGCARTMTLLSKKTYIPILGRLGLGATISPQAVTVSSILQNVRRGRIQNIHTFANGQAEIIEIEISETSSLCGKMVKNINLPKDTYIYGVVRDGEPILPTPETIIAEHDHVIIVAPSTAAAELEKTLAVQVDLF